MQEKLKSALSALRFIIPILARYNFRWVITGGFACYVYGVDRPITDIDIDIDVSVQSPQFKKLMKEIEPYITQPLEHWTDQNYDNYNFEIMLGDQVIDICPMKEMKIFVKDSDRYEPFYQNGFPEIETVNFHGLALPLLSKKLIIKNKEMLVFKRESDLNDVGSLKKMLRI